MARKGKLRLSALRLLIAGNEQLRKVAERFEPLEGLVTSQIKTGFTALARATKKFGQAEDLLAKRKPAKRKPKKEEVAKERKPKKKGKKKKKKKKE